MQLAFITPTDYLEKYSVQGDIYLALAHLIDDEGTNDYGRFHLEQSRKGRRVYLDNGLFEGAQVSTEQLLRRATAIQADVVCAPDVLYDCKGTIKAFKQFIRAKQDAGVVARVMGIPQGSNQTEWWECFQYMNTTSDCDMIGLSILSVPKCFSHALSDSGRARWPITLSRIYLIEQLYSYHCLSAGGIKPCHLLGLGESYGDIFMANRLLPDKIVSNDSSSCFVHGAQGIIYNPMGNVPGGKDHQKLNFGLSKDEAVDHDAIQRNINYAHQFKRQATRKL